MSARLITYDLNKPGQDYSDFYRVIKSYPWAQLSESSYAISTTETPQEVFNKLHPYMDGNDDVLVMTLTRPWWGTNEQVVLDWLKEYVP